MRTNRCHFSLTTLISSHSPSPLSLSFSAQHRLQMMTPLLFCVNRGYMEIVRQLIDMGADRNCSDKNVRTV
jgi:ankyrin repeat protein